jgi:internalin A
MDTTSLFCRDVTVADIEVLESLKELVKLHLEGVQVSDLSPLTELTNLRILILREMPLSDLGPLAKHSTKLCSNHLLPGSSMTVSAAATVTEAKALHTSSGTELPWHSPLGEVSREAPSKRDGLECSSNPGNEDSALRLRTFLPPRNSGSLEKLRPSPRQIDRAGTARLRPWG